MPMLEQAPRGLRLVLGAVLSIAIMVPWAGTAAAYNGAAGEVFEVDEHFQSQIWTANCGFPVQRHNYGTERIWQEPRGGGGTIFRGVFQLTITLTGPTGKTYTFRDRGTDRERLLADGSTHLGIIGRSFPNNTIGRQIEVDGEVVKVSGRTAYDAASICARLAP
jgi:hypothetical protein